VLICDDAIFMRTMVGDILQQAGFEVVGEAASGLQAIEKYQALKPDLVTMDIVMPDMGGSTPSARSRSSIRRRAC
jgi:two-component system chemotaxis response regulator CheY